MPEVACNSSPVTCSRLPLGCDFETFQHTLSPIQRARTVHPGLKVGTWARRKGRARVRTKPRNAEPDEPGNAEPDQARKRRTGPSPETQNRTSPETQEPREMSGGVLRRCG